jgi:hypothetical protein
MTSRPSCKKAAFSSPGVSAYRMCRTFFWGSFRVVRKPGGVLPGNRIPLAEPVGEQADPRLSTR